MNNSWIFIAKEMNDLQYQVSQLLPAELESWVTYDDESEEFTIEIRNKVEKLGKMITIPHKSLTRSTVETMVRHIIAEARFMPKFYDLNEIPRTYRELEKLTEDAIRQGEQKVKSKLLEIIDKATTNEFGTDYDQVAEEVIKLTSRI